jgi:prepilin-type N-terminal cleavage/methylation domain-containing protein
MRRGFTLLELIVVSALLALVASMVVPRLVGMSRREADVAAERLSEMLSLFAFRDNAGVQQSAIWLNPDTGCVELWNLEPDPERPNEPPEWVPDRFLQPVRMPVGVELAEVRSDGQALGGDEWRIVGAPGGERPRIEMRLIADGFDSVLVLDRGASTPVRIDNGVVREGGRSAIDLDQRGMDREPW